MKKYMKKLEVGDWLVMISFLIMVITTIILNIYVGLYLLSLIFLGSSYVVSKHKKGRR